MPLTPLHPLALMFLYFKDKRRIDPLALTVSASFIDLESFYYLLIGEPLDHRIWHGFALALTVYPILIALAVYITEQVFEGRLRSAYNALRLKPIQARYSLSKIYLCSLVGGASHVFFDMLTHENMPYVIYPLANGNPFYLGNASIIVESAVILLAIYSLFLWIGKKAVVISKSGFNSPQVLRTIICDNGAMKNEDENYFGNSAYSVFNRNFNVANEYSTG